MKNFLRIALVIAVVLCVAIAMVACAGDDTTTTTAGKTTTAAPSTSTAATTTPAATTSAAPTTTTVVTTTVVTTTEEALGNFLTPNLTIDGEKKNDVWFFESWGTWVLNDDGEIQCDMGAAISELVGVEFRKGSIEVSLTMSTRAEGNDPRWDTGFVFALSEPFDPDQPYYFEGGASYYFALVSDSQGFGVSRVGYEGGAWHWMANDTPNAVVTGPFFEDGEDVTIKIETDGETEIVAYINGNYVATFPIPEAENLFTYKGTDNCKVGLRAEGAGTVYHAITIVNAD